MYLYEFKGHIWDQEKITLYCHDSLSNNTENNEIESQISLMVPMKEES